MSQIALPTRFLVAAALVVASLPTASVTAATAADASGRMVTSCAGLDDVALPVDTARLVHRSPWCPHPAHAAMSSPGSGPLRSDPFAMADDPLEDCTIPTVDDRCERWVTRFDHADRGTYGQDQVTDVVAVPGGAYVVGGTWVGATAGFDVMAHRVDDEGDVQWSRIVDLGGAIDGAHDAAVATDGSRLYLTGETRTALDSPADLFVLALDAATGDLLWHVILDRAAGNDYGTWIEVGPEDDMVYTVASSTGETGVDVWVAALAAETGAVEWTERFDGPRSGNDHAAGASLSPDGGDLHIAGAAYGPMGADLFAVSYDLGPLRKQGPSWTAVHDLTGFGGADQATTMSVAPDGGIVASGYTEAGEADPLGARSIDIVAVRLHPETGEMVWRTDVAVPPAAGRRLAAPMASAVAPDGRTVVLAGGSALGSASTDFGMHVVGLEARDGSLRWSVHHQPPGSQYGLADDVAFSEDGLRAFVTGNTWLGVFASKGDLTTLALDAETGTQEWVGRLFYRDGDPRDFFPYPTYVVVVPGSGRVVAATTYVRNVFNEDRTNYADVITAGYDG